MSSARLQPALLGGAFIGVMSALPIVSAGNCCCCLWVVSGGALAVYLRQQDSPVDVPAGEGALVGLLAGLAGGIIATLVSIPLQIMLGDLQRQWLAGWIASNPDMPLEARDAIERMTAGGALHAFAAVWNVVTGAVFGTLGGLLGVAVFSRKVAVQH